MKVREWARLHCLRVNSKADPVAGRACEFISKREVLLKWSNTIGAKMITCRKNCFEQLIFELHHITVHLLSFARINFRL